MNSLDYGTVRRSSARRGHETSAMMQGFSRLIRDQKRDLSHRLHASNKALPDVAPVFAKARGIKPPDHPWPSPGATWPAATARNPNGNKIGRASCRERV